MKKLLFPTLLAACTVFSVQAQEKLSGHLYTGWLVPQNDFTDSDYEGNKPNLAIGVGMGYQLAPALTLRGDLMAGNMDGNHTTYYYETSMYEAKLGLDFNVVKLFKKDYEKVKLNVHVAPGMAFYSARMYDINTRQKLVESPVPGEKALSPNFILAYGGSVGIALTPKLDLNIGYSNRFVDEVEWMDANKSGDYSDYYGMAQVGFTYYLKTDPSKVEVDKKAYADLNKSVANLKEEAKENEENEDRIAVLEMENESKAQRIEELEAELDSAKTNYTTAMATTTVTAGKEAPADTEAILGTPQYRIIIASLPNRAMAQRFIDRSNLDKSGMVIAYIENLNTYRVIYKSYPTFEAARKELLSIKGAIPDAWVVKF